MYSIPKLIVVVCPFQQLEAIQKALIPTQNGILGLTKLIATQTVAAEKTAATAILADLRKSDQSLRDRLFVLQVWKSYDYDTAERMARRKAGDYEDPELAKVLEDREKRSDREKREREREKEKARDQAKRFKGGDSHRGPHVQQPSGRGSYAPRGRGGVRTNKRPSAENTCHKCGSPDHFYNTCPVIVNK